MEELGVLRPSGHPQPLCAFMGGGFWREGARWGEGGVAWSEGPGEPGPRAIGGCFSGRSSADAICLADISARVPRLKRKGGMGKAWNILTGVGTDRSGR